MNGVGQGCEWEKMDTTHEQLTYERRWLWRNMTDITKPTRTEVSEHNYSVYLGVPFPAAFAETVGCVLEHDLISLLDIDLVGVCEVGTK